MFLAGDFVKEVQLYAADLGLLGPCVEQLQATISLEPTASQIGQVIAFLMVAEFIAVPSTDPGNQASSMYKYFSTKFRILKKELPAKATDKMDRMIRDAARGSAFRV